MCRCTTDISAAVYDYGGSNSQPQGQRPWNGATISGDTDQHSSVGIEAASGQTSSLSGA